MLEEILSKKEELAALCRKHHVCKLAVFGFTVIGAAFAQMENH